SQVGCSQRNNPLDTRMEPHHTDAAQPLFEGDAKERKAQPVERMRGVSDGHSFTGKCCQREWGILLEWFWAFLGSGIGAAQTHGCLARGCPQYPPGWRTAV